MFLFKQQVQNFGEPFFLVIHEAETLAEVKLRIQKKLQVPDEEFSKVFSYLSYSSLLYKRHLFFDFPLLMYFHLFVQWKFAFMSLGRPEYLQDTDVVFNRFQVCFWRHIWSHHFFRTFYFYAKWCFKTLFFFFVTLQRRDVYGAWEQYLGLEHSDNTPKRAYVNQVRWLYLVPGNYVKKCSYQYVLLPRFSHTLPTKYHSSNCKFHITIAEPSHIWETS